MNQRPALSIVLVCAAAVGLIYCSVFIVPTTAKISFFDARAVQHLIGFFGLAIVLHSLTAAAYSWEIFRGVAFALLVPIAVAWLELAGITSFSGGARTIAPLVRTHGTTYVVGLLVMAAVFRTSNWKVAAGLAMLVCMGVSLYWELWHQPFVSVYGGTARGSVQWSQVVADALAISLAACVVWGITICSTGRPTAATELKR